MIRSPDCPAYIHLQDGGNTDNSGIFSLLRRGYRHIIYAHGTQEVNGSWEALTHLKFELERNGYTLKSADDSLTFPSCLRADYPADNAEASKNGECLDDEWKNNGTSYYSMKMNQYPKVYVIRTENDKTPLDPKNIISTIHVIAPAVSFDDFRRQLTTPSSSSTGKPEADQFAIKNWHN